ncbi:hypothetical protein KAI52_04415 [Candidatus Parcubacteria bacterium]|nr:hypothetical protein [Candidatus Parcubacteria bacterium]
MNIDLFSILITFILSVVGILITIVIRKKHKITFFNQKSINLFNYITKEIKDIEIKYKKEDVGVNI